MAGDQWHTTQMVQALVLLGKVFRPIWFGQKSCFSTRIRPITNVHYERTPLGVYSTSYPRLLRHFTTYNLWIKFRKRCYTNHLSHPLLSTLWLEIPQLRKSLQRYKEGNLEDGEGRKRARRGAAHRVAARRDAAASSSPWSSRLTFVSTSHFRVPSALALAHCLMLTMRK